MSFWTHALAALIFIVAPMWAINPILGGVMAIFALFAVELIHGKFDYLAVDADGWVVDVSPRIDALLDARQKANVRWDASLKQMLSDADPYLAEEVRRRLNDGDGA
jgi:hypothetical protein